MCICQKRAPETLELELKAVGSSPKWVLGTDPGPWQGPQDFLAAHAPLWRLHLVCMFHGTHCSPEAKFQEPVPSFHRVSPELSSSDLSASALTH